MNNYHLLNIYYSCHLKCHIDFFLKVLFYCNTKLCSCTYIFFIHLPVT